MMKKMKKISIITGYIIFSIFLGNESFSQDLPVSYSDDFYEAVYRGIEKYTAKIPFGKETDFGFNSIGELEKIRLGKPHQLCVFDENTFDISFQSDTFQLINRWSVPLLIDNEYRCFIDIVYEGNSYAAVGFGLHELANDVGVSLNSLSYSHKNDISLFVDNNLATYCLVTRNASQQLEFYPFRELKCNHKFEIKKYYSVNEMYKILRNNNAKTKYDEYE
jgi:hypothetical protein